MAISLPKTYAVWLAALVVAVLSADTCYYPDGSVAKTYTWVACKNSGTGASSCCIPSEGDTCLSNGLCNWVGHYVFRGACTDQTWKDGACPSQFCPQSKNHQIYLYVRPVALLNSSQQQATIRGLVFRLAAMASTAVARQAAARTRRPCSPSIQSRR